MSARMMMGLSAALAMGALALGCSAPPPPSYGDTRSEALQDSAYNSLINDPATGTRDWKSANPTQSGIAYWHVGWVSKKGSGGAPVEYVLATGYDRLTQKEAVEVVIPQTANDVAYQFRSLSGVAQLDEDKLVPDVASMGESLANVLSTASASTPDQGASQCVARKSSYRSPGDPRTLRRCRIRGSAYDSATGGTTPPDPKSVDPIVVFLNIALDVAQAVQDEIHCDPDVRGLGDDYRGQSAEGSDWGDDCANHAGPASGPASPAGPSPSTGQDAAGRTAGSACPTVGEVCFSSDGSKRGTCGADYRCWQ